MKNSDQRIDDIVDMLDSFMEKNGGHMNIKINESKKSDETNFKKISVSKSLDCMEGTACSVPTLFEGMDDPYYEEKNKNSEV